ncbi:MAG: chemotaxis protein CheV [Gammaproteobacteria bacterium]|nr:chemotaxis protein CheV [Gammaproteobacteria bacterium]
MQNKNASTRTGNRLELLLFLLGSKQQFGINVLKMQEVIPCPALTQIPKSHPTVKGMAHLRGLTLPIIDLSQAIGNRQLPQHANNLVIITEFNRKIMGFLVSSVDRIEISNWSDVLPPPTGTTTESYLSGVIQKDDGLVQILDVERVLEEVLGIEQRLGTVENIDTSKLIKKGQQVLVVDDSSVAIKQISRTLNEINVPHITARDGKEALDILNNMAAQSSAKITDTIPMVISDIEMPEMDGYTLIKHIRNTPSLSELYLLMHTSLNGSLNIDMARKCGANDILEKFIPEELASAIAQGLKNLNNP